jgi:hypothetical protein
MSYVGEVGKNNASGSSTAIVVNVTTAPGAGHFLCARIQGTTAISSVTDSKGNTWSVDKAATASPLAALASTMQNVGTLTTSDTITVTYTTASNPRSVIVDEFSAVATSPLDQVATATGTTTNRTGGTTPTTTQADELIIGCFATGSAETSFTHGTGYSDFTTKFAGSVSGEYQIVAATGAYNPTATGGVSATSHGVTATYKLILGSTLTKTQTATARIQNTLTATQSATAKIIVPIKTQSAVARIQATVIKTQTAKARVQITGTNTQGATAHIHSLPVNTVAPAVIGSLFVVGVQISVDTGTWIDT